MFSVSANTPDGRNANLARCTECGAAVVEDLKFCGYCGAKLDVISGHTGSLILANTSAILDALAASAPHVHYAVVGRATRSGQSDGLILQRRDSSFWWSDGDVPAQLAAGLLNDLYSSGAIIFDDSWQNRCPTCLRKYHFTRAVYAVRRRHRSCDGVDWHAGLDPVALIRAGRIDTSNDWSERMWGGIAAKPSPFEFLSLAPAGPETKLTNCPSCISNLLSSEEYIQARWTDAHPSTHIDGLRRSSSKGSKRRVSGWPGYADFFSEQRTRWDSFGVLVEGQMQTAAASLAEWEAYQTEFGRWARSLEYQEDWVAWAKSSGLWA